MKHIFTLVLCLAVFTNCKNDVKTPETPVANEESEKMQTPGSNLVTFSGEYIYYADAAVLTTGSTVYGIEVDEKAKELFEKGKDLRKEDTDGVMVQIKGELRAKTPNTEGWPFIITIKEIISVKAPDEKANEVVKIGS